VVGASVIGKLSTADFGVLQATDVAATMTTSANARRSTLFIADSSKRSVDRDECGVAVCSNASLAITRAEASGEGRDAHAYRR
jgi:hypothetical protein